MKKNNVAWYPTLYVCKQVENLEGVLNYARKKVIEIVKIHDEAFKNFHNSGILIGAMSDVGSTRVSHHVS